MNPHAREVAAILEVVGDFYAQPATNFTPSRDGILRMAASYEFAGSAAIYLIGGLKWSGWKAEEISRAFADPDTATIWRNASVERRIQMVENEVMSAEVPF